MTIEQKRRELFEAWFKQAKPRVAQDMLDENEFVSRWMFEAYCAALDAVVIELPRDVSHVTCPPFEEGRDAVLAAIESTNLGLKVLP